VSGCGLIIVMAAQRDNVVFEAGYFVHAKGHRRVLVIRESGRKRSAKMPADLGGAIYAPLPDLANIEALDQQLDRFRGESMKSPTSGSMKLRTKTRKGSRVIRRYDQPRTPWARVLRAQVKPFPQIQALKATLANTDPFKLSCQIDQQLDRFYSLAAQRHGASSEKTPIQQLRPNFEPDILPSPSLRGSAWRNWTFSNKLKHQQYEKQRHMRTQPSVRFSHDSTNPSSG